jgi:ABC-type Na+ efflux pump permease subunit
MYSLIPIVNVTLMVREALSGTYHWPQMGVAVLASLAFMVVVIRMATGLLAVEDLIAGSHNGSLLNYFRGKFQRQPSPKSQP